MYDAQTGAEKGADVQNSGIRLPKNVTPLHYNLKLEPDVENLTFHGEVEIDLDVVEDTTSISLNTNLIEIQSVVVTAGFTKIRHHPDLAWDKETETTKISLAETISAGNKVKLSLSFTGVIPDSSSHGLFRGTYMLDGEKKYILATQLQATDARRVFPCFDDPALKAKFTVTLIADKHLTCLSNMDAVHEQLDDDSNEGTGKKSITFRETPLMSTYLFALTIGELNVIETDAFHAPVRVFATTEVDIEQGRYALDLAARTLSFYEAEFDSKYPLPKMDMVAVPGQQGAMENWGLILYNPTSILLDEKTGGLSAKRMVASTVQHELAHQWFGNLVTMEFWDGLWLNEGFATWMSWYSTNAFYPEWKVWEAYVSEELPSALGRDSLRNSHPIEIPLTRVDQIVQIFDPISYSKGSAVIRMISKNLGEPVFLEGIRRYLKTHAYGNTKTSDLWSALSDASGKDVGAIMAVWTKKIGYPVLTVTEDASTKSIRVKQNRFLRTGDVKPDEDETIYPVSLGLLTKSGIDASIMLTERQASYEVPDLEFFKLNADHPGFYRTSYSSQRLAKLGEAAKDGRLSVADRAGMVADAAALAGTGHQKTSSLLGLFQGFKQESEYIVWDRMLTSIMAVRYAWAFEPEPITAGLKKYMLDLCSDKAHQVGWDFGGDEDYNAHLLKALLFENAGKSGDEKVIAAAFAMLKKFADGDRAAIHPDIRDAVYGICISNGGSAEYEIVLQEFRNTALSQVERLSALRTLGFSNQPELTRRTLDFLLSPEVQNNEFWTGLTGLLTHHRIASESMWPWVQQHWPEILGRFPGRLVAIGLILRITTYRFTREEHIKDIEAFFSTRSTQGFDRDLALAIDNIKARSRQVELDGADMADWLREHDLLV